MENLLKKSIKSAADFNARFMRERRLERSAYFDLQTFVSTAVSIVFGLICIITSQLVKSCGICRNNEVQLERIFCLSSGGALSEKLYESFAKRVDEDRGLPISADTWTVSGPLQEVCSHPTSCVYSRNHRCLACRHTKSWHVRLLGTHHRNWTTFPSTRPCTALTRRSSLSMPTRMLLRLRTRKTRKRKTWSRVPPRYV